MTFASQFIRLPEARRIIRERTSIPKEAADPVLAALEEGALVAEVKSGEGWSPVRADWWQKPPIAWPSPYMAVVAETSQVYPGDVRVVRADLDRLWPIKQPAIKGGHQGGAPLKHDWEGAFIEMARVAVLDEPCDRRILTKRVADWFAELGNPIPADSEIRKKVKRFHETLWPPRT